MESSKVFVDSSMFKALIDPQDDFRQTALIIWDKLKSASLTLTTSNYIVDETFTLIRTKCGLELAKKFRAFLIDNSPILKINRVVVADEANAWEWFVKDWSKLSFTDCVSFAMMKRLGLTRVATFDTHYTKAGMKVEK